jgi:hypothetical protein
MKTRQFEILAKVSLEDRAPDVNVAETVLSILQNNRMKKELLSVRVMMWTAAACWAAAVPAVIAAVWGYNGTGPLAEVFNSIAWMGQ